MVIARTNRLYFFNFVLGPSTATGGRFGCKCGNILSIRIIDTPPNKNPIVTGSHGMVSCFESSNDGERRASSLQQA